MPQFHIDEVYTKGSTCTTIVNFLNGFPSDNFDQKCSVLEHPDGVNKIAAQVGDVLYAGDQESETLVSTFILAKNRKTGKVRLIEVDHADMKPILNLNLDRTSPELDTSQLELSRKFGSKKQKQKMEQREKFKVNTKTVTEQMKKVTENITEEKLDLSSYNKLDNDDFYLPPIDRTAARVEDVYDVSKILTEEQFERIYAEIDGKDYMSDLDPFVKNIVIQKKDMSPRLTVVAVFADTLLKQALTHVKDICKKGYTACQYSITLHNIIMSVFLSTSNGRIVRPLPYKDKIICHFIVFMLLLNNFKLDLNGLSKALKMTPTAASLRVRVCGAWVITNGDMKIIQLKVPLNSKGGFKRRSAKF